MDRPPRGLGKRTLDSLALGHRTCILCGETKPFNMYHWLGNKGVPTGNRCRLCWNNHYRARYHRRKMERVLKLMSGFNAGD